MFVYWGRRGALSQFTLEAARVALADTRYKAFLSVSRQNECFEEFAALGPAVMPVDTFESDIGGIMQAWRIRRLRRRIVQRIKAEKIDAVIDLMPHVWSSFVAPAIKAAGARYIAVIHDAGTHPGDYRSFLAWWSLQRAARSADLILTLSGAVAGRIEANGIVPYNKILTLFHPDLDYSGRQLRQAPAPGKPIRLLFFGRIMRYKGLPMFLDAVELLRADGVPVEIGVFGEGQLGSSAARLQALGAEVVNRWLSAAEIGDVLRRYHAVVLSHTEASQSGVAATAFGAGLPVVATPVGGLIEQVRDGVNGVLAERADAQALKEAFVRLLGNPQLYRTVCKNLATRDAERSMATFVERCVVHALTTGTASELAQPDRVRAMD